jgi:hypothetical protein
MNAGELMNYFDACGDAEMLSNRADSAIFKHMEKQPRPDKFPGTDITDITPEDRYRKVTQSRGSELTRCILECVSYFMSKTSGHHTSRTIYNKDNGSRKKAVISGR